MQFQKAQRKKAKLRLALTGPSGSGKTYGALLVAKGLGGKIAVIDTERGSASLYSHLVDFDVLELDPPYNPERFLEAMESAEAAGYGTIIIDSITHEWNGIGGCLEINDALAKAKYKGNTWSAWNDTTPRHRAFIDAILRSPMHVIATMRSKTETAQIEENGRKKVAKLGMKSEQRDGLEYEFTVVLDICHDGNVAMASKDRTELFRDPERLSEETGTTLLQWLESGKDPVAMAAEEVDEAIAIMQGCDNLGDLQGIFGGAWRRCPKSLQAKLEAAYENIKTRMQKANGPTESEGLEAALAAAGLDEAWLLKQAGDAGWEDATLAAIAADKGWYKWAGGLIGENRKAA